MEEVSSLLYINQYAQDGNFDVIILDCAPTGESLRFISIPATLEWYISKIFKIERKVVGYLRPVVKRIYDVPLPEDDYFKSLENLFVRLEGVDHILTNPDITTVRLVANPEKIVLKETQRSFLYFSLYKMCIDGIVMNRILPGNIEEAYFDDWKKAQKGYLKLAEEYFSPVPIFPVTLFQNEPLGKDRLKNLGMIYMAHVTQQSVFMPGHPYKFTQRDDTFIITIKLPFLTKEEVELTRLQEEIIIRIGGFKRHMPLPRHVSNYSDVKAK